MPKQSPYKPYNRCHCEGHSPEATPPHHFITFLTAKGTKVSRKGRKEIFAFRYCEERSDEAIATS